MDTAVGEDGVRSDDGSSVSRLFFAAIWAAAGLGLAVQGLSILARLGAGAVPSAAQVAVDLAGGVSWSVIVCGALSLGVTASQQAGAARMGLLGLLGAPLAFSVAKGVQSGVQWLADLPVDRLGPLVLATAGLKTAEYALLGMVLGRLIGTPRSTPVNHTALGAVFGLVFGGMILAANFRFQGALPLPRIAGMTANEFVFPIACSVLIYWVSRLTDTLNAKTQLLSGH